MKIAVIATLLVFGSAVANAQVDCGGCGGIPPKAQKPAIVLPTTPAPKTH